MSSDVAILARTGIDNAISRGRPPVETASRFANRLRQIRGDSAALLGRHQAFRAEHFGNGDVACQELQRIGRGDEARGLYGAVNDLSAQRRLDRVSAHRGHEVASADMIRAGRLGRIDELRVRRDDHDDLRVRRALLVA